MYAEIGKEAFNILVGDKKETFHHRKHEELAERAYYFSNGVMLQELTNYIGSIVQYYVRDINS